MFSEGPNSHYQPAIRELQRAVLVLAHDITCKVNPDGAKALALEAIDWFPEEPVFWINLAESLSKGGDMREAIAKKIVLSRVVELLPFDKVSKVQLLELGCALGQTNSLVPIKNAPFGPPSKDSIQKDLAYFSQIYPKFLSINFTSTLA